MRNLDCYLTENEKLTISDYLLKGEHSDQLDKIVITKYIEWETQLNKLVSDNTYTYRDLLDQNGIKCPVQSFFAKLYLVLKHDGMRAEYPSLLLDLEKGISECEAPCPCPGDC